MTIAHIILFFTPDKTPLCRVNPTEISPAVRFRRKKKPYKRTVYQVIIMSLYISTKLVVFVNQCETSQLKIQAALKGLYNGPNDTRIKLIQRVLAS